MRLRYVAAVFIFATDVALAQTETHARKTAPPTGFLKHFTIESFGYTGSENTGYEFAPASLSAFYNTHQLTCPLCIVGPRLDRARPVLPPFGAEATYGMRNNRFVLSAGFGGIDGVPGGNAPLNPALMRATSFDDDWFVTSEVGARIYVDPQKRLSFGISHKYINDFGPGKGHWTETAVDVTFSPGLFPELAHGVKTRCARRLHLRAVRRFHSSGSLDP